jgi:hypothetical protein
VPIVPDGTIETTHELASRAKSGSVYPGMVPVTATTAAELFWLEAVASASAGAGVAQALRLRTIGTDARTMRIFDVIFNYSRTLVLHLGTGERSHDVDRRWTL